MVTGVFSSRFSAFYGAVRFINSLAQEYLRLRGAEHLCFNPPQGITPHVPHVDLPQVSPGFTFQSPSGDYASRAVLTLADIAMEKWFQSPSGDYASRARVKVFILVPEDGFNPPQGITPHVPHFPAVWAKWRVGFNPPQGITPHVPEWYESGAVQQPEFQSPSGDYASRADGKVVVLHSLIFVSIPLRGLRLTCRIL